MTPLTQQPPKRFSAIAPEPTSLCATFSPASCAGEVPSRPNILGHSPRFINFRCHARSLSRREGHGMAFRGIKHCSMLRQNQYISTRCDLFSRMADKIFIGNSDDANIRPIKFSFSLWPRLRRFSACAGARAEHLDVYRRRCSLPQSENLARAGL